MALPLTISMTDWTCTDLTLTRAHASFVFEDMEQHKSRTFRFRHIEWQTLITHRLDWLVASLTVERAVNFEALREIFPGYPDTGGLEYCAYPLLVGSIDGLDGLDFICLCKIVDEVTQNGTAVETIAATA